jgi:phage terminase large subunit GpA-like protein
MVRAMGKASRDKGLRRERALVEIHKQSGIAAERVPLSGATHHHSDTPIEEHHKTAMLAAGEWRPTADAENPHTIGFHISALYSPVGWLSWEQIARDWEAAQGKAEDLKTFRNTVLGETWQDRGEAPDWERLVERREDFRLGIVAQDALVLTAGVDVQDDRLECDIWAWAEGYSSWLVDHIVIAGSPRERAPWDALADLLARDWPRAGGGAIRIAKACVDIAIPICMSAALRSWSNGASIAANQPRRWCRSAKPARRPRGNGAKGHETPARRHPAARNAGALRMGSV